MLVDHLGAASPHKQNGESIELSDLTLKLDAVDEKQSHVRLGVAEMFEERILDRCGRFCGHV